MDPSKILSMATVLLAASQVSYGTGGSIVEECTNGSYVLSVYLDDDASSKTCDCPPWIGSSCCQVLDRLIPKIPVCSPDCQNGGVCISNDTCSCQSGFYGTRCEIGGNLEETLKPQLHPALPLDDLFKPLSWYNAPEVSWNNRVCFVKIATVNASMDTIIAATSQLAGNDSVIFGNFTAAPIDGAAGLNGSSRAACLQVRCPGETLEGTSFDVDVDITVTSAVKRCTLRYNAPGLDNMHIVRESPKSDGLSFTLHNGDNYGSKFGVYIGTGYRERALLVGKQTCHSGNWFDLSNLESGNGTLAMFDCL